MDRSRIEFRLKKVLDVPAAAAKSLEDVDAWVVESNRKRRSPTGSKVPAKKTVRWYRIVLRWLGRGLNPGEPHQVGYIVENWKRITAAATKEGGGALSESSQRGYEGAAVKILSDFAGAFQRAQLTLDEATPPAPNRRSPPQGLREESKPRQASTDGASVPRAQYLALQEAYAAKEREIADLKSQNKQLVELATRAMRLAPALPLMTDSP